MQAYVCQEKNIPIIYLSPMRITQLAILGHDIRDDHPALVNLDTLARLNYKVEQRATLINQVVYYMYNAMKKIKGNGCILAAHQIG
jgi:hypothetical protein